MNDYGFRLHLPLGTLGSMDVRREHIKEQLRSFTYDHLRDRVDPVWEEERRETIDPQLVGLLRDLADGCFWRVLTAIDGYSGASDPEPESLERREEHREWARANFTGYELNKLLNLCADTALFVPFGEGDKPGCIMGHETLHRELVRKKDSMFYGVVDSKLERRLDNGRFWEFVPELFGHRDGDYNVVEDVLMNHSESLDVDFALGEGREIFCRNSYHDLGWSLDSLTDGAIDRYFEFIKRISPRNRDRAFLGRLVRAYTEVVGSNHNFGGLRFEDSEKRLKDPLVKRYGLAVA